MKKIFPIIFLLLTAGLSYGQLGFCTGSKGDPIFFENFGSGTDFGPPLSTGVTSYTYISAVPHDGEYTLHFRNAVNETWHHSFDHTPDNQPDGTNGKALIVNAGFTAGEFYKRTVNGLCVNTTFEFSAWLMNLYDITSNACGGTGIPIDVTFEIWDITETNLIKTGSTGPIAGTATPIYTQYGLTFTTLPGQTSVVLKIRNNGVGGCGNDLAIDDIGFRACGDVVTITSPSVIGSIYTSLCQNSTPVSIVLNANATNTTPHIFQWQQSTDNLTWADIPGAIGTSYTTPNIISTHYYRTRLAQDAVNLANAYCSTVSDIFSVFFLPKPLAPITDGDVIVCSNETIPPLSVTVGIGENVNWFDAPTGGNLLASNTTTYAPPLPGVYYAESHTAPTCVSDTRTAVMLKIYPAVLLSADEIIHICSGSSTVLDAAVTNVTYDWLPGNELTQTITVSNTGNYTVTVTTPDGCTDTKTFIVFTHDIPVISSVDIDETTVTINTQGDSFYLYSLDGGSFQNSNVFYNVHGGMHSVYVKDISLCGNDTAEFLLIFIPKYFTPNDDTYHDFFEIEGMEFIPEAKAAIFDRYGKLITVLTLANPKWDGTYNGRELPSTDYWYRFFMSNGEERKGHFSLKR